MKRKSAGRLSTKKSSRPSVRSTSQDQIVERLALLMQLLQHNIGRLAQSRRSR